MSETSGEMPQQKGLIQKAREFLSRKQDDTLPVDDLADLKEVNKNLGAEIRGDKSPELVAKQLTAEFLMKNGYQKLGDSDDGFTKQVGSETIYVHTASFNESESTVLVRINRVLTPSGRSAAEIMNRPNRNNFSMTVEQDKFGKSFYTITNAVRGDSERMVVKEQEVTYQYKDLATEQWTNSSPGGAQSAVEDAYNQQFKVDFKVNPQEAARKMLSSLAEIRLNHSGVYVPERSGATRAITEMIASVNTSRELFNRESDNPELSKLDEFVKAAYAQEAQTRKSQEQEAFESRQRSFLAAIGRAITDRSGNPRSETETQSIIQTALDYYPDVWNRDLIGPDGEKKKFLDIMIEYYRLRQNMPPDTNWSINPSVQREHIRNWKPRKVIVETLFPINT